MGVVGYSDSEGSDNELAATTVVDTFSKTSAPPSRPAFQKVIDRSNPRKILVTLPGVELSKDVTQNDGDAGQGVCEGNERPVKKTKTAGAFSDFNSFLPAPKNTTKPVSTNSSTADGGSGRMSRLRGAGLGTGVNLKTGAAPAFSRTQDFEDTFSRPVDNDEPTDYTQPAVEPVVAPAREVRLVGKSNMFKPLSVARKPAKRKVLSENAGPSEGTKTAIKPSAQGDAVNQQLPSMAKPKKSLFSTEEAVLINERSTPATGEYVPLDAPIPVPNSTIESPFEEPIASQHTISQQPATLGALADSLSLTPAQRRQLFGRNGGGAAAQIANFNLSAEYKYNTELRESGETAPLHNPIRSIAPGKHSLQQLVNMATNQRDALEESFAAGKNNKKEAGSKYGW